MRIVFVALFIASAACSSPNPSACCETDQQCKLLGVSQHRPCQTGQTCAPTLTCSAIECETSADCLTADAPVCINRLCTAKCTADMDCLGAPGAPFCASDGACVGCTMASQCSTDKPFCDMGGRVCRGCIEDTECGNGVCVEAEARCVDESQVVYVDGVDNHNTGTCPKTAPCTTLAYAISQVGARNVVKLLTGQLQEPGTVTIARPVVIDGSNTTISVGNVTTFSIMDQVMLENAAISSTTTTPVATVAAATSLTLFNTKVTGTISTTNGTVIARRAAFVGVLGPGGGITCNGGTVNADHSTFTNATVNTMNCVTTIANDRFVEAADGSVHVSGGLATIQNNLIAHDYELADSMSVSAVSPGSIVRFNTFVNTSNVISDGAALVCDSTVAVTSNIFAYQSMHPHGPGCPTRFSLYDEAAIASQRAGASDSAANIDAFFVNRLLGDFHLAPGSPARDKAEAGLGVTDDLEGDPRGAKPDIGAYEAP